MLYYILKPIGVGVGQQVYKQNPKIWGMWCLTSDREYKVEKEAYRCFFFLIIVIVIGKISPNENDYIYIYID